jgi:hypothetical protein
MVNEYNDFRGKYIEVEISGGILHRGYLIDSGLDIFVLYDGENNYFFYIPFQHVQRMKETRLDESSFYDPPSERPIETDGISYRNTLMTAKGLFVQIYVTGNKAIHGYLTSIMNDYFVFHSPVYKTMYISMNHVKWLIPYSVDAAPYSLSGQSIPFTPPSISLARYFEEQLKKFEAQLVILDGGDNPEKIGLLKRVQNNKAVLITAEGETVYWNLEHIKTIQSPF